MFFLEFILTFCLAIDSDEALRQLPGKTSINSRKTSLYFTGRTSKKENRIFSRLKNSKFDLVFSILFKIDLIIDSGCLSATCSWFDEVQLYLDCLHV